MGSIEGPRVLLSPKAQTTASRGAITHSLSFGPYMVRCPERPAGSLLKTEPAHPGWRGDYGTRETGVETEGRVASSCSRAMLSPPAPTAVSGNTGESARCVCDARLGQASLSRSRGHRRGGQPPRPSPRSQHHRQTAGFHRMA